MILSESRFWEPLWRVYPTSPSMVLCRVPELEFAAREDLPSPLLDHCCGDGLFAEMAFAARSVDAGCDLNETSLASARKRGRHKRLDCCDAAQRLPYDDESFASVFNNSAFEHIPDLDATLAEVARVLRPGGILSFSVLNHRYFEWWPLSEKQAQDYKAWQPFYHALDLETWRERLAKVGLRVETASGYFDRTSSEKMAYLDCLFSGAYLRKHFSWLVLGYRLLPFPVAWRWRQRLAKLDWQAPVEDCAGYSIRAVKDA